MYVKHEKLVSAATVSAAYDSGPFDISDMKEAVITAVWVGNLAGNLQLQLSLNGTDWFNSGAAVAAGGANGSTSWALADVAWKLFKVTSTFASGSSALTIERSGRVYN